MYGIYLDEYNRVLLAVPANVAIPEEAIFVDSIPDGDITDYLYVEGEFVYDPIPADSHMHVAPRNITEGECITVDGVMYKAITNIPNGASIITGQNAVVTTVEEQLYEMTKGE
jgi:hypothetical protein